MQFLKYNTGVDVRIGPAMAVSDGLTPVTSLNLVSADQAEILKHNGAATVDITGRTVAAVTGCDGWYDLTLTAADVATVGMVTVVVQDTSLIYPIFKDFMVLDGIVYDSLVSGTDNLQVDAIQVYSSSVGAADLLDFATSGYNSATNVVSSNISTINGSAIAAQSLEISAETMILATVGVTPTPTNLIFPTGLGIAYTTDDMLVGRTIIFGRSTATAALRGVPRRISSYDNTNGVITVNAPLPAVPTSSDDLIVI